MLEKPVGALSQQHVRNGDAPSQRAVHLVLLPGLDGTGELFAPLIAALGSTVPTTVVRYQSERSFDDYVTTAAKALSQRDVVLVAESFSGPVAIALCSRKLENIQGLVLCATFAQSPFRSLLQLARFTPTALYGSSPTQPFMLRHACLNGERDEQLLRRAVSVLRSVPAATMRARLTTLAAVDVRSLLPSVTVPTLYLSASRDRVVHRRLGRALTDNLANVVVRQIEGPHLLLQARPRECAEAIRQTFTALPVRADS